MLSEIASRALSSAVNDPVTAIDGVGSFVRLFTTWCKPVQSEEMENAEGLYPLVEVPQRSLDDMLDDAFRAIARDGAALEAPEDLALLRNANRFANLEL